MLTTLAFIVADPDSGASRFVLQVVALITGGGIVQLIVFLLRRRSEITALDRTSSAPLLASANELIIRLEESEARSHKRVAALEERLANEQTSATDILRVSHDENRRLTREVAQLRIDLDICQHQIEQLRDLYRRGSPGSSGVDKLL